MGLPNILKNFGCFYNGESWLGKVPEIALPKIALKTEQYRGGGMLGEVDIAMGVEKLELEMTMGGLLVGALRSFTMAGVDRNLFRFVGAYQEDVGGGVLAAELVVRGLQTEFDPGSAKTGDKSELKTKWTASYLKWIVSGRTEIEIDMINNVFLVDGIDQMAAVRAALQQ